MLKQTLIDVIHKSTISPWLQSKILLGALEDRARDFKTAVSKAVTDGISNIVPIEVSAGGVWYLALFDLAKFDEYSNSEDQDGNINLPLVDRSGNTVGSIAVNFEEASSKVASEVEQGLISAEIVSYLSSVGQETSPSLIVNEVYAILDRHASGVSDSIRSVMSRVFSTSTDASQIIGTSILLFTVKDQNQNVESVPFAPTIIGAASGTSGLAMWCTEELPDIVEWLVKLRLKITKVSYIAAAKYAELASHILSLAGDHIVPGVTHAITNVFADQYVKLNKDVDPDDASLDNGFYDFGYIRDDSLVPLLRELGVASGNAMAIPILGATLYVFISPTDDHFHTGIVRHLYNFDDVKRLYLILTGVGAGSSDDIISMWPELNPFDFSFGKYPTVQDENRYIIGSLGISGMLIPAGLMLLSGRSIDTIAAQMSRPQSDYPYERFFPFKDLITRVSCLNPETLTYLTRGDFLERVCKYNTVEGRTSVETAIKNYVTNVLSSDTEIFSHVFVQNPFRGSYTLMDDALTASSFKTNLTRTTIAVGAYALIVGGILANVKLRKVAQEAVVVANRAMANPNISIDDARRLRNRANWLCTLAGITAGTSKDIIDTSLKDMFDYNSERTIEGIEEDDSDISADLKVIKKSITG